MLKIFCTLLFLSAVSLLAADVLSSSVLIPLEDIHGQQQKQLLENNFSGVVNSLIRETALLQSNQVSFSQVQVFYKGGHPVLRAITEQQATQLGVAFRNRLLAQPEIDPNLFQTALALTMVGQRPIIRREKQVVPVPALPQYRKFEYDPILREIQPGTPILIASWYLLGFMSPTVGATWYKIPVVATALTFAARTAPYIADGMVNGTLWLIYQNKLLQNWVVNRYGRKVMIPTTGQIVLESFYEALPADLKQNKSYCALALTKTTDRL